MEFALEFGFMHYTRCDNVLDIMVVNDSYFVAECNVLDAAVRNDHVSMLLNLLLPNNDRNNECVPSGACALCTIMIIQHTL